MRSDALLACLLLVACAAPKPLDRCDPTGAIVEPAFARIGNDDLMNASLSYTGCEQFRFSLCGIGEDWLQAETIRLGIWHDDSESTCDMVIEEDQTIDLFPVRERYIDEFDIETATVTLDFGSVAVDYSFAPPE